MKNIRVKNKTIKPQIAYEIAAIVVVTRIQYKIHVDVEKKKYVFLKTHSHYKGLCHFIVLQWGFKI